MVLFILFDSIEFLWRWSQYLDLWSTYNSIVSFLFCIAFSDLFLTTYLFIVEGLLGNNAINYEGMNATTVIYFMITRLFNKANLHAFVCSFLSYFLIFKLNKPIFFIFIVIFCSEVSLKLVIPNIIAIILDNLSVSIIDMF